MSNLSVNIKMFQVGELGDCFLLKFKKDGSESSVLIDCGSFRNSDESEQRLQTIAGFIKDDLEGKPLDVVVGTHQHNDHLSGYVHAFDIFQQTGINNVWLSWLDDPKDEQAGKIAAGQRKVTDNLQKIVAELAKNNNESHSLASSRICDVLGFYLAADDAEVPKAEKKVKRPPVVPQMGIDNLRKLGKTISYLSPGSVLDLPALPQNSVKVYVLGPPRNSNLLFDINPNKDETYDTKLAAISNLAEGYLSAMKNFTGEPVDSHEGNFPFDKKHDRKLTSKLFSKEYQMKKNAWRTIDDEWLDQAERLSLYLDTYTNNSSLVLAFELVDSGKVLLFVGDAQTGNWLSWEDIKWDKDKVKPGFTLDFLLNNTVLYKVGHHCSHNATLKEYLDDKIIHKDLVAMIPVDRTDPNITKNNGWKMPAVNLYKKLKENTQNRVLVMDIGYDPDCDPDGQAKEAWAKVPFKPVYNQQKFYIEYEVHSDAN
jgi:beta-lactamase superfamily II metal-dependent hydrolase